MGATLHRLFNHILNQLEVLRVRNDTSDDEEPDWNDTSDDEEPDFNHRCALSCCDRWCPYPIGSPYDHCCKRCFVTYGQEHDAECLGTEHQEVLRHRIRSNPALLWEQTY